VLFHERNTASGWAFRNPRVRAVTRAVIARVRGRIDAHDQRGDSRRAGTRESAYRPARCCGELRLAPPRREPAA
jgi:hypothetical protein